MKKEAILAIETSCDETAAAVVVNGRQVLSNVIYSQISDHQKYGGVVPEIASRLHIEKIDQVIDQALVEAGYRLATIDKIAVTQGPGLIGALLVGISEAKALAYALNKPLIGVHHIAGHIAANYLENNDFEPPFLCLVASGGHTQLVMVEDYNTFEVIGTTRDDAIGEAYDKVARTLGLGYPGGPQIDKIAKKGNPQAIDFPRAYLGKDNYDFSFSGVKSAVLNYLNKAKMMEQTIVVADVAASFQQAVVDVVINKLVMAAEKLKVSRIALAGGVAANSFLRQRLIELCQQREWQLKIPALAYCTDNAAMIGAAAYYYAQVYQPADMSLNGTSSLTLTEWTDLSGRKCE